MFWGLFMALIAGSLVGMQNIFNSKVSERAGSWATTVLVLGLGFLASLIIGLVFEGKTFFTLHHMRPWYGFSGLIGVGIVVCMVQGVRRLGPTYAISIVLTSQLLSALLWDSLGWFGMKQIPLTFRQIMGVLVIVAGIIVFKFNGRRSTV
ncbi:DMT family transporter [Sporolactobacillus pectinivorans]|uniref:DMT family transporter n=1 Tax=Sporolactobacillus pectinivorans TaxID=1591408 RepID=UPI000C25B03D|nr:DMT family transporter [Sporolactobacillus pectinivorans]